MKNSKNKYDYKIKNLLIKDNFVYYSDGDVLTVDEKILSLLIKKDEETISYIKFIHHPFTFSESLVGSKTINFNEMEIFNIVKKGCNSLSDFEKDNILRSVIVLIKIFETKLKPLTYLKIYQNYRIYLSVSDWTRFSLNEYCGLFFRKNAFEENNIEINDFNINLIFSIFIFSSYETSDRIFKDFLDSFKENKFEIIDEKNFPLLKNVFDPKIVFNNIFYIFSKMLEIESQNFILDSTHLCLKTTIFNIFTKTFDLEVLTTKDLIKFYSVISSRNLSFKNIKELTKSFDIDSLVLLENNCRSPILKYILCEWERVKAIKVFKDYLYNFGSYDLDLENEHFNKFIKSVFYLEKNKDLDINIILAMSLV